MLNLECAADFSISFLIHTQFVRTCETAANIARVTLRLELQSRLVARYLLGELLEYPDFTTQ